MVLPSYDVHSRSISGPGHRLWLLGSPVDLKRRRNRQEQLLKDRFQLRTVIHLPDLLHTVDCQFILVYPTRLVAGMEETDIAIRLGERLQVLDSLLKGQPCARRDAGQGE